MTPQELRKSVLKLAVQGKLVEQRIEEGSSKTFIDSIKKRQEDLISQKKIKVGKYDKVISDCYYYDIPETWTLAKLGDLSAIITKQTGFDYSNRIKPALLSVKEENTYPLIQTRNFKGKQFSMDSAYYLPVSVANEYEQLILNKQCLLVSIVGSIGNVGWFREEEIGFLGGAITKIDLIDDCMIDYLFYFLQSPYGQMELQKNEKKTAQATITVENVRNITVPIPPYKEQKRIVDKIEELMTMIDRYEESFVKLENFNKKFPVDMQKSILQVALQGKLVEQSPEEGTAEELYQQIQKEKQRLIKEGKIKKEKPLAIIAEDEIPFDVPESWKWVRLASVLTVRGGKRIPVGERLTTIPTSHIYIRVTDMQNGTILENDLHYIPDHVYEGISRYIITEDDIYIVIVGNTIGKCGTVPKRFSGMNLTENAARLTPHLVDKQYLKMLLSSNFMQRQFIDKTNQVGVPKLAITRLETALLPLPPLNEQRRIVAKIEELLPLCEGLKTV